MAISTNVGSLSSAASVTSSVGAASSSSIASSSASPPMSTNTTTSSINLTTLTTSNPLLAIQQSPQSDLFHFVCFVPINGRLYELDGLKPYPVDHGPLQTSTMPNLVTNESCGGEGLLGMLSNVLGNCWSNGVNVVSSGGGFTPASTNWTSKFKQIILNRLSSFNAGQHNHEIRFNLMAVVPDRMSLLKEQIDVIVDNRLRILKILNEIDLETDIISNNNIEDSSSLINSENSEQQHHVQKHRQLRSSRSKPNVNNNPSATQQKLEIQFNMSLNPLIQDFLKQLSTTSNGIPRPNEINMKILNRLRVDLVKLIERIEFVDMCKLFRILDVNEVATVSGLEEMFIAKKWVSLNEFRLLDSRLRAEAESDETKLNEEIEKRKKYKVRFL